MLSSIEGRPHPKYVLCWQPHPRSLVDWWPHLGSSVFGWGCGPSANGTGFIWGARPSALALVTSTARRFSIWATSRSSILRTRLQPSEHIGHQLPPSLSHLVACCIAWVVCSRDDCVLVVDVTKLPSGPFRLDDASLVKLQDSCRHYGPLCTIRAVPPEMLHPWMGTGG